VPPRLFAYYSPGRPMSLADLSANGSRISVLAPNWFTLKTADLTVYSGSAGPLSVKPLNYAEVLTARQVSHFQVWPVINAAFTGANGGPGPSADQAQLDDPARRARIVAEVARLARAYPEMEGFTMDFEGLWGGARGASQNASYTALVTATAAMLHGRGLKLAVYSPRRICAADAPACTTWSAQSYDWAALAGAADLLTVGGYDEGAWGGSAPGAIATSAGWQAMVGYAVSVSPANVVPTLAVFGYEWPSSAAGGGVLRGAGELDAQRTANNYASITKDGETRYTTAAGHVICYENDAGSVARANVARDSGMTWWGINTLGREQPSFWTLLGG
jgi:spore germination protein YaaH